ncbi:MAG: hypothetical protein ACK5WV_03495 [Chryseotalea sp.]|jgi:hypothetical protein
MRARKLGSIPTAGDYEEIIFEFEGPWRGDRWNYVLFTTTDFEEWLGMFRDNDLANFKIAELNNGTACVVSGGHGYIVDIDKKKKLKDLKTDRIIDITSDNKTDSYIISTWYDLTRVTKELDEVEIKLPIQTDGIYFDILIERKLNLVLDEIGADMNKIKDFYVDLDDMTVKKHAP